MPSVWTALLQIIFVYPAVVLLLTPALEITRISKGSGDPQPAFADMGLVLAGGAVLGIAIGRFWPALARTGRWLWLLPAIFLLGGLITQTLHPPPAAKPPCEYFYFSPANEGLAVFLVTLPACCLAGYAAGLWGALRLKGIQ